MSTIGASPYINFAGKAREALEFYHAALGGQLDLLAARPDSAPVPAEPGDAIMHGSLQSDGLLLMGSDGHLDYPATVGDNIAVTLWGTDNERLSAAFDALAAGGIVKQTLKTESWGDSFGYFVDKFGINWMVNISPER